MSTTEATDIVVFRVQAMQRFPSYFAAIIVIAVIIAGVVSAMDSRAGVMPGLQTNGPHRYESIPTGADGPLKDCVVCHSVERDGPMRAAPPLYGIVGAKKARMSWFGYSPAMRKAGGTWTEADLDKLLTSPSKFIPGTTKTILGYSDAKKRADIIAALKKAQ